MSVTHRIKNGMHIVIISISSKHYYVQGTSVSTSFKEAFNTAYQRYSDAIGKAAQF